MNDRTNQYPAADSGSLNPPVDPRRAQLIALFDMSDERGKVTLLAIAGIHAARYPKGGVA